VPHIRSLNSQGSSTESVKSLTAAQPRQRQLCFRSSMN
jgi:hypothetical protein